MPVFVLQVYLVSLSRSLVVQFVCSCRCVCSLHLPMRNAGEQTRTRFLLAKVMLVLATAAVAACVLGPLAWAALSVDALHVLSTTLTPRSTCQAVLVVQPSAATVLVLGGRVAITQTRAMMMICSMAMSLRSSSRHSYSMGLARGLLVLPRCQCPRYNYASSQI